MPAKFPPRDAPLDKHDSGSRDLTITIILFFIAVALRLPRLFQMDVWFDEVAVLLQTRLSFVGIWNFCKLENFPPLYPAFVKIWSSVSVDDHWLRLQDLLLGAAIPPVVYHLGKEIHGKKFGILVALACAASIPLVYYSQVVRMYSLFVLSACVSYFCFIRALKTEKWGYWIAISAANVIGFYSFLFMSFVILSEAVIVLGLYRFQWKKYFRPLVAQLPAIALILLWVYPLLDRYSYMHTLSVTHLSYRDVLQWLIYSGTGVDFRGYYVLALILNVPFLVGLFAGVLKWRDQFELKLAAGIYLFSLACVILISMLGPTLFYNRYLLFLLPLHLILVIYGWLNFPYRYVKRIGPNLIFGLLLVSYIYYQVDFLSVNDEFRYLWFKVERKDGHSTSKVAEQVSRNLKPGEVVIHFSDNPLQVFSFFPCVWYHQRSLPEHIYSKTKIPFNAGGQYLRPGEWIASLDDLHPPPEGVWLITWYPQPVVDFTSLVSHKLTLRNPQWQHQLPAELYYAGYRETDNYTAGNLKAVHFRLTHDSSVPDTASVIK